MGYWKEVEVEWIGSRANYIELEVDEISPEIVVCTGDPSRAACEFRAGQSCPRPRGSFCAATRVYTGRNSPKLVPFDTLEEAKAWCLKQAGVHVEPTPLEIQHQGEEHEAEVVRLRQRANDLQSDGERLRKWVDDLQSDMYINCVYCGFRYGPQDRVPVTMADALKEHIEGCPEHPLSHAKDRIRQLEQDMHSIREKALAGWDTTTLAQDVLDALDQEPC